MKKVRLDRREETIGGKKLLLRGNYVQSRDHRHKVICERVEDQAVKNRATRRTSPTTLVTWYGSDGSAATSKRFGGRFAVVALSDAGDFLAAMDRGYDDIPVQSKDVSPETREARELSESYFYVFDRSWRTVYSTSALRGEWDPVQLSPSGNWLVYENVTENDDAGRKGWFLTAVELATKRSFKLIWERDLHFLEIGDDGSVSGQRFLGLTEEKHPVKWKDGSVTMNRKAIYIKLVWKPYQGGGFKKAE